jgi:hypothetical protein
LDLALSENAFDVMSLKVDEMSLGTYCQGRLVAQALMSHPDSGDRAKLTDVVHALLSEEGLGRDLDLKIIGDMVTTRNGKATTTEKAVDVLMIERSKKIKIDDDDDADDDKVNVDAEPVEPFINNFYFIGSNDATRDVTGESAPAGTVADVIELPCMFPGLLCPYEMDATAIKASDIAGVIDLNFPNGALPMTITLPPQGIQAELDCCVHNKIMSFNIAAVGLANTKEFTTSLPKQFGDASSKRSKGKGLLVFFTIKMADLEGAKRGLLAVLEGASDVEFIGTGSPDPKFGLLSNMFSRADKTIKIEKTPSLYYTTRARRKGSAREKPSSLEYRLAETSPSHATIRFTMADVKADLGFQLDFGKVSAG